MDKERVREQHPCFGARQNRGRIHLPVCPGCNLECRFCDRKINEEEERPGVTARLIKPEEAVTYVEKALRLCPELSVIGIAGPGTHWLPITPWKPSGCWEENFPGC